MKLEKDSKYFKAGLTAFLTILACLVCFFVLYHLGGLLKWLKAVARILHPFLYGGIIAYLLTPACRRLERGLNDLTRGKRPRLAAGLAVALSLLLGIVLMTLIILIVIPQVWQSVVSLVNVLPGQITGAYNKLYALLDSYPEVQSWIKDVADQTISRLESWSKTDLLPTATSIVSNVAVYMSNTFVLFKDVILGIVISVYLLATRRKLAAQGKMLLRGVFKPHVVETVENEIRYIDRMFNGFFMAKLLDSVVIGVLCFIGCLILGLPSAPLISVIVGITNIIPMFGPFIGAVPCALLLLLENPMHCLVFIIFTVVLQQLDGNVIGPRIMGNSTGLSGFWVTFAIILFGGFWGVSGMLIGVPLLAVLYDGARRLIYRSLRLRGKEDMITDYNQTFHPEKVVKPIRLPKRKFKMKKK